MYPNSPDPPWLTVMTSVIMRDLPIDTLRLREQKTSKGLSNFTQHEFFQYPASESLNQCIRGLIVGFNYRKTFSPFDAVHLPLSKRKFATPSRF